MPSNPVRIWHDDIRHAPDETWIWCRTNDAAKEVFNNNIVTEISMDHDLGLHDLDPNDYESPYLLAGDSAETGYDLVNWMIKNYFKPAKIRIHSWNPDGAWNMAHRFNRFGYDVEIKPFNPKEDWK